MTDLALCPCGEVPKRLVVVFAAAETVNGEWAFVHGSCCKTWKILFRNELNPRKAWNAAPRPAKRTCTWTEDDDGNWFAACEAAWSFSDGGPAENNVRYCHSCGAEVVVKPYKGVTFP